MPAHARTSSLTSAPKSPPSPYNPLESALSTAQSKFTIRNPISLRTYNQSLHHLPGGNTRTVLHTSPFPLTFASGEACKLTSVDGHTYTDFLGEYTAGIYGHNSQPIYAAMQDALRKGWSFGGNNTYEKELAKVVCQRFKETIELVRFTNSGTEANLMAIGAAINFTGQKKILVFENSYHGGTLSFISKGRSSMNVPHDFVLAPYNDISKTRAILFGLPPRSLAAILVEPMQGSGGCIAGSPKFLHYLREAATEYGALLIFDEAMTSRLSYGGLGQRYGIRPDLMTLGKWVGGGMTFGAFGGRKEIMGMFDPRNEQLSHSGTFNNNIVTMSAGLAGCKLLDVDTINALDARGQRMKEIIEEVLRKNGIYRDTEEEAESIRSNGYSHSVSSNGAPSRPTMYVTGIGSLLNVHFFGDDREALQGLFFHHMLEENIYLAPRGFMALSIEIKDEHVEAFVVALERFVVRYKQTLDN
ncbi:MAG: hypothetical protein M1812_004955 [Candelaria pacifica]|nr:MAG: hypothetical protein M1812_004955 [Candelaria pacifica]